MDALLAALEGQEFATYLRFDRWGYAAVNATHILGLALLVGAIVPLDLRLLGVWRSVPRAMLVRVLVPVAATGLAVAIVAGVLLFSVKAQDYAAREVMQIKLVLVATGAGGAILLHARDGFLLETAGRRRLAAHALLSLVCWLGALTCGRLIGFMGD